MIIPVSKKNEFEWANLNAALWPKTTASDALKDRAAGNLPNEYLYYINDEAAAFISLSLRRDYVEGTDESPVGYLEAIYVKPEYRKHGIASKLVSFAKEWAISNGCTELASDCELCNEDSRLFHTKIGFEEANRIICFTMKLEKPELARCPWVEDIPR
ncbi:MAG: GNAT family N-acetyltransferase [Defluviitaleaceae bacterium]|nr:GNAT family N-acetyltransferase [Defluviitaleaceae bacterium]